MDTEWNRSDLAKQYQPLVLVFAATCAGIIGDRFLPLSFAFVWCSTVITWLVWLLVWRLGRNVIASCLILATAAGTGATWHHVRWNLIHDEHGLAAAPGSEQRVCVEAIALNAPSISPAPPHNVMNPIAQGDSSEVSIRAERIRDGDTWRIVSGKMTLRVDGHLLDVYAGDRIRVVGILRGPPKPRNVGEFDVEGLMRTRGETCSLITPHPECIQIVGCGTWHHPRRWLSQLRSTSNALLWQSVNHQQAGLAAAILLGAREQIDRERNEDFFLTGTIHLLAISGLHVGMLAYMIWFIARTGFVSRHWVLIATAVSIMLYSQLTNSRPPVMRATVLIVTICVARLYGRQAFSFNTLALAGLFVLAVSPGELFQTGTQLSFLAVATLACCSPLPAPDVKVDPLDRLIAQSRPRWIRITRTVGDYFKRLWITSTVIWLVALPLVAYRFHVVTPIAVLLNPVLMIPIAVALFSGFGVIVFGWLFPPLGWMFGWVCGLSLWFIESCVQISRPIAGSHFFLPAPAFWWVIVTYAGLATFVWIPRMRPARRWFIAIVFLWLAVGTMTSDGAKPFSDTNESELTCTFIAVGHGTSVVVELPNGQTFLYDAGRKGAPHVAARAVTDYLWSRGIMRLDGAIISHADADHYNAIPEILKRVTVGVVYVSPMMFAHDSRALSTLRGAIEEARVPIREIFAGDSLRVGSDVSVWVMHPTRTGVPSKFNDHQDNANSIVLQIEFAGHRILLPGDLESAGMDELLSRPPNDFDIVMAPHHGSSGSDPRGFAAWTTPEWVIISGGERSDMDQVARDFQAAGARVLHTERDGAVQIKINSNRVEARSWSKAGWQLVK